MVVEMNQFGVREYTEEDYKEFFEWLLEREVNMSQMVDITLLDSQEKPMVYYPGEIKRLLETKAMQRLKRVAQLGSSLFANEDNFQTRFSHSLGAGNNAQKFYIKLFKENPKWRNYIQQNGKKEEVFADIIQMYVHDIGHNVLSHTLEKLIISNSSNNKNSAAHEILGQRIINNDPEIKKVLSSISPTLICTINRVASQQYDLRTLKEGAVDFDRLDYLIRDALYYGDYEDRYITERLIESADITINNSNGKEKQIPAFSIDSQNDINDFLVRRIKGYQNNYMSNQSLALDKLAIYFCLKIATGTYDCDLKHYILHCMKYGGDKISLEEFKNWDDTRFYSEVIKIAQNHPDENIRELAIHCLPSLKGLTNWAFETCDLDYIKKLKELPRKEKKFFTVVRDLVKKKSDLHDRLLAKKGAEIVILNAESNVDMQNVFDDLVNDGIDRTKIQSLFSWNKRIWLYNPKDPIYVIDSSQKVMPLQQYVSFSNVRNYTEICGALAYPMQMKESGFTPEEISIVQNKFIKYNLEHKKEENKLPSLLMDSVECENNIR